MFEKAIRELEASGSLVGRPHPFQECVPHLKGPAKRIAQHISINSINDLHKDLQDSKCMVFRLGMPPGIRETHFALAKVNSDWSDYFFLDNIFEQCDLEEYLPSVSVSSLSAFKLLPTLTETSYVNLALGSGLLPQALGITSTGGQTIPATCQSTFTFDFQPLSVSNCKLTHNRGQVEIDALFVGQRDGKKCLFVVEAKSSKGYGSLAKHKLLYPILAVQKHIQSTMDIVPVYLRAIKKAEYIEFNIAECSLPIKNGVFGALDQLEITKTTRHSLRY